MAGKPGIGVRNVGILGHGGTGKTTLIEHILYAAGKTTRVGRVADGNTVGDYLDEEIARRHTIALKLTHCEWNGTRVHMVDHPGYMDFVGEVAASTPVLDGVIIVVDATTGIELGTDNAYKYAETYRTPRAFFVNKLNRENADFAAVVAALQEHYGAHCVPLSVPVGKAEHLTKVVNVLTGNDPEAADQITSLKSGLADSVAESDDALLEKYLETGELTPEEFSQGLQRGIKAGKIVPILAGSAEKDLGIRELMDLIVDSFPSPLDRHVVAKNPAGEDVVVAVSSDAPLLAQVFRSVADPHVGQLTLLRVLTGTLRSDSEFFNVTTRAKERSGKVIMLCGKEQTVVESAGPGDLVAMTKLKNTHFGDTLAVAGTTLQMPKIPLPESMVKLAIFAKSRADEDRIGEALNRIAEEEPTFRHYRDAATNEHVIKGIGDQQLEILLARMKRKFNVEAETRIPKVAYKETVKGTSSVQGKHKKQTGGHGQYGDVHLKISPNERGAGYKFVDSIVGGVVPRQYIPHVDRGCQEALERGVIAGYPVVDLVVELHYGSYHDVDSSELAFKIAAAMGIQKGIKEARPCILEPVMEITVTVPDDLMGDITGDLNSRRGRIMGMGPAGPGRQMIRALVPEADVLRYSTDLRSMTSGRGSHTLKFSHYDELPEHIAQGLMAAYEKARAAGE